jgi:hypothetical protein
MPMVAQPLHELPQPQKIDHRLLEFIYFDLKVPKTSEHIFEVMVGMRNCHVLLLKYLIKVKKFQNLVLLGKKT